mgnify:CR=1 FL=1
MVRKDCFDTHDLCLHHCFDLQGAGGLVSVENVHFFADENLAHKGNGVEERGVVDLIVRVVINQNSGVGRIRD